MWENIYFCLSQTLDYVSQGIKYLTVQMNRIFKKYLGILEDISSYPPTFLGFLSIFKIYTIAPIKKKIK